MRLLTIAVCLCLVLVGAPAGAQSPPSPPPQSLGFDERVLGGNVTPPGNRGHFGPRDVSEQPDNVADQVPLYVDFGRKDFSFARPGEPLPPGADPRDALGEPYSPRDGLVIFRDGWGVPRIFGQTDADAQFGVGYAMAEDRLFQADIFRRVARGEMAELIGGQEWFDYDREWRREFYTDAELLAQFERFYTPEERALVRAYVDGINAYIAGAQRNPELLPAEYAAVGAAPRTWEVRDSLAVFVLQARDSVEGFGDELYNAALLADLRDRLGGAVGQQVFDDTRFVRDPGAYVTAPRDERPFPYPGGGFEGTGAPGVALPDDAEDALAAGDGQAAIAAALQRVGLARKQASNAITVSGRLTRDGRPLLLGGPQLDYLVPGIFYEFEVHSPSQHARGVGFAGTAGIVLIGKTPTHAWSITYGYTDQIDVFLVPLDPARPASHYLRGGESLPLQTYTTTVTCRLNQSGMLTSPGVEQTCDGAPVNQTQVLVERVPEYGPVIDRVTRGGQPHAVVKVRAHWDREIANGRPFINFNRPSTLPEMRAASADFNVSLNIHAIDSQGSFGFWHAAAAPVRAHGTDVRLPTLGDGRYDWQGFVPFDDIPHAINPAQGYTVNWNNQISAGWHNGDSNSWAELQRVDMLVRPMAELAARGDVSADDVWAINRAAAYEDGRWADFLPLLEEAYEGTQPTVLVAEALAEIRTWNGQRTATRDDDGTHRYDSPAVAIWDRWLRTLQRSAMADELGTFYDSIGPEFAPAFYHLKSALLLRFLRRGQASLPPAHDWLDGEARQTVIRAAFAQAAAELAGERGPSPSAWRVPAVLTTYRSLGLGSAPAHPFMNRGTYNQLVTAALDPLTTRRVAGPGRIDTAVAASQEAFSRAETVVVASAGQFPDALTATPLAARLRAPILLTGHTLPPQVAAEVQRLRARTAVIAGGAAAVPEAVADSLRNLGLTVRRIGGVDRYATAALIADELGGASGEAFIANGERFPDALSGAPLAAAAGAPVLLTRAGDLPPATAAALQRLNTQRVVVLGGTVVVGDAVASSLPRPTRVSGPTRYATSVRVAELGVTRGLARTPLHVASGRDFPDALAAGAAAASQRALVLLIDGRQPARSPESFAFVDAHRTAISLVVVYGGTAAVTAEAEALLRG